MGKTVWQPTVIDKMISNEKYIGAALMQKPTQQIFDKAKGKK